ncbi:hypothetical protein PV08_02098 [Exophiala spinifera]|uniref:Uncharacterized protein n=1 Tax=Exophiala spinifera TaxID=91928 RepID=A0A0D2BR84_9EURO|nr:uncharacterized protein PV08_02098 [Exophiala spinifera]KIW21518.1 hypothetical protein PV08_02098 [Exophiala spinifera]
MSGIYSVEDLLKLRASPLICRPPNLPPIEEWMGHSTQDTTTRKAPTRGKQDDSAIQNEPFQKRPALLDNQHPDRIVLGPPRRSFASSNVRPVGKLQDDESGKRNGDWSETKQVERRSTQTNGRHNQRDGEDQDTEVRRTKWAARDRHDHGLDDDEDFSRGGFRQNRGKFSQPWFRKDAAEADDNGKDDRHPDWRRGDRRDREWDRQPKAEAEPEWMDTAEPEEPFQVRTQEDFQRWKEKMKAGATTPQDKAEPIPAEQAKSAPTVASPEPDDSMDKFFARFESKVAEPKAAPVKAHGKTRFASLFSPPTEQSKQVEAPAAISSGERPSSTQLSESTSDADQAGFARILEMLQTRSNNPTPQTQETTTKPRTPLYARGSEPKPEMESRPSSQTLISLLTGQNLPQPQDAILNHGSPPHGRVTDPDSPIPPPTHTRQQSSINKDEVLLNLLRQASLAPKPQPPSNPHQQAGAIYGMPNDANMRAAARNQMVSPIQGQEPLIPQRRETGRSMFDESPVSMYQNEQQPREDMRRRATNSAQSGLDDPLITMLRGQGPPRPMQAPQSLPPGLQRPPGLEQIPRQNPNWLPQQPLQPQQQASRQQTLPPGLSGVPRGLPGAPYPPLQQMPGPPQPPQPRPPQPPQRKYTGESGAAPGMPNMPPGMFPPPGFVNAGPPPGFPGSMAGHQGRYQSEPGPGPQPPMNRAFMEMYGEAGGRGVGLRGGAANAGMPPFR